MWCGFISVFALSLHTSQNDPFKHNLGLPCLPLTTLAMRHLLSGCGGLRLAPLLARRDGGKIRHVIIRSGGRAAVHIVYNHSPVALELRTRQAKLQTIYNIHICACFTHSVTQHTECTAWNITLLHSEVAPQDNNESKICAQDVKGRKYEQSYWRVHGTVRGCLGGQD